jgi:hypothetical protein
MVEYPLKPDQMNNDSDKENISKTVSRNSLFTVIYNGWYLGSRLVLTPVILSYVTIEEYGLWSYCFVVLSYLATTAFGFNNTYIRYTADYRSRNENEKLNELVRPFPGALVSGSSNIELAGYRHRFAGNGRYTFAGDGGDLRAEFQPGGISKHS